MKSRKKTEENLTKLFKLLEASVLPLKNKKVVLLFSGGIDSVILAEIMKKQKIDFTAITCGTEKSPDIKFAEFAAKKLKITHEKIVFDSSKTKENAISALKITGLKNPVQISIAISEIALIKKIKKRKILVSGLGSDEIFAGYQSHQTALKNGYSEVQKECKRRIKTVKTDISRIKKIADAFKKEVYFPFLEKSVVRFGLNLDPELKISKKTRKIILRKLGSKLNLPEKIITRPKKAMQYGSGSDKLLKKLAKKEGFKSTNEFLNHYGKHIQSL